MRGRAQKVRQVVLIGLIILNSWACGYHIAGKADLLPKDLQTIAVLPFSNETTQYRIARLLPRDITRELIKRTRYHVVYNEAEADAVLRGHVLRYDSYPTVFDPATGRATAVQMIVIVSVSLTDRRTGQLLYQNPYMELREQYEISVDQRAFVDESELAIERMSRDAARSIVSAILENF